VVVGDVLKPGQAGRAVRGCAAENVVQWNQNVPSFSVYRGRITESRAPKAGELALAREDQLLRNLKLEVLFREMTVAIVQIARN
jgi:hypothetical protein